MKKLTSLVAMALLLLMVTQAKAQDKPQKEYVYQTFKDTRVINTYSIETLQARQMDVRIAHRFGDFFNQWTWRNAWSTFFGFETAADVAFGVEYGITNNLMVGFHRTKGYGPLKSNLHGIIKYKPLAQTKGPGMPISLAVAGSATISTMWRSDNTASLASFGPDTISGYAKFSHRLSYSLQVHVARKFGNAVSIQMSPTFVWRNLVDYNDENYVVSIGLCAKFQLSKVMGLIIDSSIPLDVKRINGTLGYIPLGIGLEFDTGGHVFQVNFTNSAGIEPTDYIPYTDLDWTKGQFRIGFTISRAFRM